MGDFSGGAISIDGIYVRDVTLASLRSRVGVVFEEAFLFSDTVHENIAYGRPDATREQVRAAARVAGAERFIDALPNGFDTVVGERGLTLSGGQRQRIALARAVVSDPGILVLDDATSAVDTTTEEAIHSELRSVMAGRTTILVAHRASTVRLADRVVLLDRGQVVEEGTHDQLLARSAAYRALLGDEADRTTVVDEAPSADGITVSAWPDVDAEGTLLAKVSVASTRAATGAPGKGVDGKLPEWKIWTASKDAPNLMVFDSLKGGGVRMISDHESPTRIADDLLADKTLKSDDQRCQILKGLARDNPEIKDKAARCS